MLTKPHSTLLERSQNDEGPTEHESTELEGASPFRKPNTSASSYLVKVCARTSTPRVASDARRSDVSMEVASGSCASQDEALQRLANPILCSFYRVTHHHERHPPPPSNGAAVQVQCAARRSIPKLLSRCWLGESRLEGVNRQNLKFIT
jgi:hypothetical protein